MGGKSSAPPPPDYRGAAEQQAQASRAVTEQQTWANRPQQYTPWGASEWMSIPTWDEATQQWLNRWQQNISLTPEQQASLDAQMRIGAGRSGLAESLLGRAGQEFGQPVGWEALDPNTIANAEDQRSRAEEAIYGRLSSRLDPQWNQEQEAMETRLWNQGLRPGDEAYNTAMENFNRSRTDAYQTAMNEAIMGGRAEAESQFGMDMSRRQQALAEALQRRGWSLNEINAILSGQQIGMPQMPGFQAASRAEAPQYLPAAIAQGNYGLSQYGIESNLMGGMFGGLASLGGTLGAAAMQGAPYAFAFSDRRLKSNIWRIGRTPAGQPVYSYTIFGRQEIGVMADESPSIAVHRHPSGFLMVDYSRIR